jgi:GNAT superfamily N-acetyltransferase
VSGWSVRPIEYPQDAEQVARFSGLQWRESVSVEQVLQSEKQRNTEKPVLRLFAEVAGEPVAMARAFCWGDPKEAMVARIYVLPEHRKQGIASDLSERIHAFALQSESKKLTVSTFHDEPEGLAFIESRGFTKTHILYHQEFDLTAPLQPQDLPEGYTFTSYAELEGDDKNHRVYECVHEADKDVPHIQNFGLLSYDDFLRHIVEPPTFIPSAFALALYGDQIVGVSNLLWDDVASREKVFTDFTGVRRAHRGQGLAKALKYHSLKAAQALGAKVCITMNSDENAPMLAINRAVGFQIRNQMVEYVKELRP